MAGSGPRGYSRLQIALHWLVVVLVVAQYLFHDGIEEAFKEFGRGRGVDSDELLFAWLHVAGGLAILALVVWRLALRLKRGVPPLPEGEHPVGKFAAHATHWTLYALLVAMPLSGGAAWFRGIEEAAELHETGKTVLLALIGLHVAGALVQHFVIGSDVLKRMLFPQR